MTVSDCEHTGDITWDPDGPEAAGAEYILQGHCTHCHKTVFKLFQATDLWEYNPDGPNIQIRKFKPIGVSLQ